MTAILCRWLNEDVGLSQLADPNSFAEDFANGYLFGELLHKFQLQQDFKTFSKFTSSEAKLGNFLKLEPSIRALKVPFDANLAQDIMQERPGVAARLAYQLFVALSKLKADETTWADLVSKGVSAAGNMPADEHFQSTLRTRTPRQADIDLKLLEERFRDRQRRQEAAVLRMSEVEEQRADAQRKAQHEQMLSRSRELKRQYDEKVKQLMSQDADASPSPSMDTLRKSMRRADSTRQRVQEQRAKELADLDSFDDKLESSKREVAPHRPSSAGARLVPIANKSRASGGSMASVAATNSAAPTNTTATNSSTTPRIEPLLLNGSDSKSAGHVAANRRRSSVMPAGNGQTKADNTRVSRSSIAPLPTAPSTLASAIAPPVSAAPSVATPAINPSSSLTAPTISTTSKAEDAIQNLAATAAAAFCTETGFVETIRRRKEEDEAARHDRERRRRRLLIENMEAQKAVEQRQEQELLLTTILRQSKRERRIAQRLVHLRREKEIIQANRAFRQQQAEERRRRDFEEALNREAALAAQQKAENQAEIAAEQKRREAARQARQQAQAAAVEAECRKIVSQVVNLATLVADYRLRTQENLPVATMRELKTLLQRGLPLTAAGLTDSAIDDTTNEALVAAEIVTAGVSQESSVTTLQARTGAGPASAASERALAVLDDTDFLAYHQLEGEWALLNDPALEESAAAAAPHANRLLGHVVHRLVHEAYPPPVPWSPPSLPVCRLRVAVVGKPFAGKSTALAAFAADNDVTLITPEAAVEEAIAAYDAGELAAADEPSLDHYLPPEIATPAIRDAIKEASERIRQLERARAAAAAASAAAAATPGNTTRPPSSSQHVGEKRPATGNANAAAAASTSSVAVSVEGEVVVAAGAMAPAAGQSGSAKASHAGARAPAGTAIPTVMEASDEAEAGAAASGSTSTTAGPAEGAAATNDSGEGTEALSQDLTKLSVLAQLGKLAKDALTAGQAVDERIVCALITIAIQKSSHGLGWIIDGYPTTAAQAAMLERCLTGQNLLPPTPRSVTEFPRADSLLAPDVASANGPRRDSLQSGLDAVIVVDVSDADALQRALGRRADPLSQQTFHLQSQDARDGGLVSGETVGMRERLIRPEDPALDGEQMQSRLAAWQVGVDSLVDFYKHHCDNLHVVSGAGSPASTQTALREKLIWVSEAESRRAQAAAAKMAAVEAASMATLDLIAATVAGQQAEMMQSTSPANVSETTLASTSKEEPEKSGATSPTRAGSAKSGAARPTSAAQAGKSGSQPGSRSASAKPPGSASKSRPGTTAPSGNSKSLRPPTSNGKGGKSSKSPNPSDAVDADSLLAEAKQIAEKIQAELASRTAPPEPQPGLSPDYKYADLPVALPLAEALVPLWQQQEQNFVGGAKQLFRQMRSERQRVLEYVSTVSDSYMAFLTRPDAKQEYVSQWQQTFNDVPADVRLLDATKAELHQRIEDLRDTLHEICDQRRDEAEQERESLMANMWREDRVAIMLNCFLALMQLEINRYHSTQQLLADYYEHMCNRLASPLPAAPLMPLLDTTKPPLESSSKFAKSKAGTRNFEAGENGLALIPRMGLDPASERNVLDSAVEAALNSIPERPHPKLAREKAAEAKANQLSAEAAARAASGGKKKGAPAGKAAPGKKTAEVVEDPVVPLSPEEIEAREKQEAEDALKAHAEDEWHAAALQEDARLRARMMLLRTAALRQVESVRTPATRCFAKLEELAGQRYRLEVAAVDKLCREAQCAVESGTPLLRELVLSGASFQIDDKVHLYRPQPKLQPEPLPEVAEPTVFTMQQLWALTHHLRTLAPSGIAPVSDVVDLLQSLQLLPACGAALPPAWTLVAPSKIQAVVEAVAGGSSWLDWRWLVVDACNLPQPPAGALVQLTHQLHQQHPHGWLTRDEWDALPLWLDAPPAPADPHTGAPGFHRSARVRELLFELYAGTVDKHEEESGATRHPAVADGLREEKEQEQEQEEQDLSRGENGGLMDIDEEGNETVNSDVEAAAQEQEPAAQTPTAKLPYLDLLLAMSRRPAASAGPEVEVVVHPSTPAAATVAATVAGAATSVAAAASVVASSNPTSIDTGTAGLRDAMSVIMADAGETVPEEPAALTCPIPLLAHLISKAGGTWGVDSEPRSAPGEMAVELSTLTVPAELQAFVDRILGPGQSEPSFAALFESKLGALGPLQQLVRHFQAQDMTLALKVPVLPQPAV